MKTFCTLILLDTARSSKGKQQDFVIRIQIIMVDVKWQQWVVHCWLGQHINASHAESIYKYNLAIYLSSILVTLYVMISNTMLIYGLFKVSKGDISISKKLFIYLSIVDLLSSVATLLPLVFMYYSLPCMSIRITYSVAATLEFLGLMVLDTLCTLRYSSLKNPLTPISSELVYKVIGVEFSLFFICLLALVSRTSLTEPGRTLLYTQGVAAVVITSLVVYAVAINLLAKVELKKIAGNGHSKRCNDIDKAKSTCRLEMKVKRIMDGSSSKQTNKCPCLNAIKKTMNRCSSKKSVSDLLDNTSDLTELCSCCQNVHLERARKQKREALKTLTIITFFYVICFLPIGIILFVMVIGDKSQDFYYSQLYALLNNVWNLNAGLNSTIYIVRTKELRRYFNIRFGCRTKYVCDENSSVVVSSL